MNVIERIKHELKYNASPAIPYIKLGKGDADILVKMAEENQTRLDFQTFSTIVKQTHEIERLRKALEFYAKSENYEPWRESDEDRTDAFNFVDLDGGQTAREALAIGEESNAL